MSDRNPYLFSEESTPSDSFLGGGVESDDSTLHFKASQEDIDKRYKEYHATVNMSASELEAWSKTECSKLASLSRSPITRNLKLLRTKKADWGQSEYKSAGRTISFVSRMRGSERGKPVREGCPSKRDISLKNWAYNPNKSKNMELNSLYNHQSPKEIKQFGFQVTDVAHDDERNVAVIKGYGAVFGNVDLGRDVITRGAFSKTLADKGNKVYFLADHKYDTDNLLGVATVEEDEVGLIGSYEINLDLQKGREIYSQAKQMQEAGLPLGMSIGYDVVKGDPDPRTQVRILKELRLHEISLTMFPMNPEARVTSVKNMNVAELERLRSEINSLLEVKSQDSTYDDEAEIIEQIENLTKSLKDVRN